MIQGALVTALRFHQTFILQCKMYLLNSLIFLIPSFIALVQAFKASPFKLLPALWKLQQAHEKPAFLLATPYPEYNFSVPVDHLHNETRYAPHSDDFFDLRYWFDAQHYREGGPVFVIAAGEAEASERLPFLSHGIVSQLAAKYNGIGVILEHRYYGKSYPVDALTPENIRFLSTDQAIADYAYFARNVVFPGLEHLNLTASRVPWIAYGGSYAGAFVAFLRKLYPDVYWGAVSSSGVTAAIEDYWEYMEPIRQFGPSDCIKVLQTSTDIVDRVLIDHADNESLRLQLQSAFGLSSPLADVDFAAMLSLPLGSFQGRNWDPAVGSDGFLQYCTNITSSDLLYPDTEAVAESVKELIHVAGYDATNFSLVTQILNYAGYFNTTIFSQISNANHPVARTRILPRSDSTSWAYQVCTEWGYFITGSSVPSDIMPLVSRLIDLSYTSSTCASEFAITTPPNTDIINKHGGFDFSHSRVAIIDGLADPWRQATPHADVAPARRSTDDEPFLLIDIAAKDVWDGMRGAVHHWDQNGLTKEQLSKGERPPGAVVDIHREVVRLVGAWLKQWKGLDWKSRDEEGQQVMQF